MLGVLVLAVGVPLIHYVPIDTLRVVVGALLLVLGLSWLRKAILRASGHKALHDEDKIYADTVAELSSDHDGRTARQRDERPATTASGSRWRSRASSWRASEVVLIVISLGAAQNRLGLAALAAGAAVVLVGIVGLLVARQLSEVPENTIKTLVGVMLTSFGVFWVGEGAGVTGPAATWPSRSWSASSSWSTSPITAFMRDEAARSAVRVEGRPP